MSGIEFDPQITKLLLAVVVAERRQREAEVWSVPPAFEPLFVPSIEEVPALAVTDDETPSPVYAPDADTLMDVVTADYQTLQPAVDAVGSEHQPLESTIDTGEPTLEEKTPLVPAEPEPELVPAAMEQLEATPTSLPEALEAAPTPAAVHAEALTAVPYGDVLVHQAADDEPLAQTTTGEAPPIVHHDSAPDNQQESAPKISS